MTPDATAVVTAVRAVLTTQLAWQGTASELLHALAAADGTLALPGNARAMAAHLRGAAPLLRESGIEMSFVRSGHAGTRTIRLAPLSAAYAGATQLSATDALTQADEVNAQFGLASPLPVDPSRSIDSRPVAQPLSDAADTLAQVADANRTSLTADANQTSSVLTQAADASPDTIPDTHTWLHSSCRRAWRAQRRFRAVMAVGGGKLCG